MGFIQAQFDKVLSESLKAKNIDPSDPKVKRIVDRAYQALPSELAKEFLETLYKRRDSMLADRRWRHRQFVRRNEARWRQGFDFLEMHIEIAMELGEEFNADHRPEAAAESDYVFEVLTRIHARACLVAREIVTLLRNGFADGAHARWRTLHELAVTAKFISKHGQKAAYRYLSYEHVEKYKRALNYQEHCAALEREPLTADEINDLKLGYESVCEQFGKDEFTAPYGWAAEFLTTRYPKFPDLEKDSELDYLNPYYKMANSWVHATPRGLSFQLSLSEAKQPVLLTGPSNGGLVDPAQCTAASLLQVTRALLSHKPTLDAVVTIEILQAVARQVGDAFVQGSQVAHVNDGTLTRIYRAAISRILLIKERYASWKWWRKPPDRRKII